jgi:Flp pilus assembly protein CpaB
MGVRVLLWIAITVGLTSCACSWTATEPSLSSAKNVPVVVATKDIPASSEISADMVTIEYFSADQAPPFAFRSREIVVGKYLLVPIHAGQAITDNLVSASPQPH